MNRRSFLSAGLGALTSASLLRAANERVGVGVSAGGYVAALRAITASGTWPYVPLLGRKVAIKPNLVSRVGPETGITTDVEVVRAVVDLCLAGGAADIRILETTRFGAAFEETGYNSVFGSYHPAVKLVDMFLEPHVSLPVPGGQNISSLKLLPWLQDPDVTFISVGKLKTHSEAMVTLTCKNLFGLPEVNSYIASPPFGRFGLHDRGVSYTIVDLMRARPIHYAVIDGIWGMEGDGPIQGTPIRMNTVLAGLNAVAVDRIGATAMEVPPNWIRHLGYLSSAGFGPADVNSITVAGDALTTKPFVKPIQPPILDKPHITPSTIDPGLNQVATIYQGHYETCVRTVDIQRLSDDAPAVHIRQLQPYSVRNAGVEVLQWDGRDDGGEVVPPGRYAAHTRSFSLKLQTRHSDSINWIEIVG